MKKPVFVFALIGLALTGCSSAVSTNAEPATPGPASTSIGSTQGDSSSPEPPSATATPTPTKTTTAGPVLLFCNESLFAVNSLDPATGVTPTFASFTPTATPTFSCGTGRYDGGQVAGPRYRQLFSEDYSQLATNWKVAATGAEHVGYTDSAGQTVDVTAMITGNSDFSAVPHHANALFAPNGTFFFVDKTAKTFNWLDLTTKKVVRTIPNDSNGSSWWVGLDGDPESTYNMSGMNYAKEIRTADPSMVIDLFTDMYVSNWFDDSRALAVSDGRLGILSPLPGDVNHNQDAAFATITPESDFRISSAIADPEGKTVFFVAAREQQQFLFTVPADGSAAPTRQRQLNPGESPVFIGYQK